MINSCYIIQQIKFCKRNVFKCNEFNLNVINVLLDLYVNMFFVKNVFNKLIKLNCNFQCYDYDVIFLIVIFKDKDMEIVYQFLKVF